MVQHVNQDVYLFLNDKCTLFELLCTLSRLCEEKTLQPLELNVLTWPYLSSPLDFILVKQHNCHFSIFVHITTEQGEMSRSNQWNILPNLRPYPLPPSTHTHTHIPLSPCKVNIYAKPRHSMSLCTARGSIFSLIQIAPAAAPNNDDGVRVPTSFPPPPPSILWEVPLSPPLHLLHINCSCRG